jgi:hypothetical protein
MKDLDFISCKFVDFEISAEKKFLFKYFRTNIEQSFVKYYFCFGEYVNFTDHVGLYCQLRWLKMLKKRIDKILQIRDKAKKEMDFDTVFMVESGKYKVDSGGYKKRPG